MSADFAPSAAQGDAAATRITSFWRASGLSACSLGSECVTLLTNVIGHGPAGGSATRAHSRGHAAFAARYHTQTH